MGRSSEHNVAPARPVGVAATCATEDAVGLQPLMEYIVLVDAQDRALGTAEKLEVHRSGRLHRAFSVFVLDGENRMLLQQRAAEKYHSGGLWSNTCCGHPKPQEDVMVAAKRRLVEEMGLHCELVLVATFVYRAELDGGLTEHEVDHVFVGRCDQDPTCDPREVQAWQWIRTKDLRYALAEHPERYTPWLPIAMAQSAVSHVLD
jgi:isopentenyl-diphosphate Delta-isomerase